MPKDFKNEEHGLRKLRVATRNGVIFASYSDEVEALEEYLTPAILADFDTVFPGKKLKIHGYYRNELPCNWKMYHENLKDPYHATLLHSFLVVFGLLVAGNKSAMLVDTVHGRHGTMASAKSEDKYASVSEENKKEMRSFHDGLHLQDDRFLEFVKEFDSPWSVTMQTIWPNLIVQREMNTLGVRQIVPNGPDSMIMQWTMFGYEDDTPEMERHRLRQGNLMGPAGFLGLEDNEAMKFVQEGVRRASTDVNVLAGIRQAGHVQHADLGSRHPLHVQLLPRRDGLLRQEHQDMRTRFEFSPTDRSRPRHRAASGDRGIPRRLLRRPGRGPGRILAGFLHRGWPVPRHRARERRPGLAGRPGLFRGPRHDA